MDDAQPDAALVDGPEHVGFRAVMGAFTTGVTVVTTASEGVRHGMTANAFTSVSLDPPLVLVCVDRGAGMHGFITTSERFAVTVLAATQRRESIWFASPWRPTGEDQLAGVPWQPSPVQGVPLLSEGLAYVDCRLHAAHDGGDHSIFVGAVVDAGPLREDAEPLVYHGGNYHQLGPALR